MSPQKFYSVTQVCKKLGIQPHTLRYWEKEFEIKFKRNSAGRRIVSSEQLKKLELIQHLLHREKMTVKGAKRKLATMNITEEEIPQTKDYAQLLLWLKKQLIELRALLKSDESAN
ncbi:MerR family transcriptional regulator [candidate division WOR-3 bacterium]|nr:MerR family transcriptional regulator [candidate division WOR-3 bacterium]